MVAVTPAEVSIGVAAVVSAVVSVGVSVGVLAATPVGVLAVVAVPPNVSPALVYAFET